MRDPRRIEKMIGKLRQLWLTSPDLRLGQLVEDLTMVSGYGGSTFNVEDEELDKAMDQVLQGGWG